MKKSIFVRLICLTLVLALIGTDEIPSISGALAQETDETLIGSWKWSESNLDSLLHSLDAALWSQTQNMTLSFFPDGMVVADAPDLVPDGGQWYIRNGELGLIVDGENMGSVPYMVNGDQLILWNGKGFYFYFDRVESPEEAAKKYRYRVLEDGTAAITGYDFSQSNRDVSLDIPFSLDGYLVTGIDDRAFSDAYQLSSVTLPIGTKYIGAGAFQNCTQLKWVKFNENVEVIGENAFFYCSMLSRAEFPAALREVGASAFEYCTSLQNIVFEEGTMLTLGDRAFAYCMSLTELRLPRYLKKLPTAVFIGCSTLPGVELPEELMEIGESAFESCMSITEIGGFAELFVIRSGAFRNCMSLSSIKITLGTQLEIGTKAFENCYLLQSDAGVISINPVQNVTPSATPCMPDSLKVNLSVYADDRTLTDALCKVTADRELCLINDLIVPIKAEEGVPEITNIYLNYSQQWVGETFEFFVETSDETATVVILDQSGTELERLGAAGDVSWQVAPLQEGMYGYGFLPMNAAGNPGERWDKEIVVLPQGVLGAPEIIDLAEGEWIDQKGYTIHWKEVAHAAEYVLSIRDLTDDVWVDQEFVSVGTERKYSFDKLTPGHDYSLALFAVPQGEQATSLFCGCTRRNFSYLTIPTFQILSIDGSGSPGDAVSVRWGIPTHSNGTAFYPENYVVYLHRWNYQRGAYDQLAVQWAQNVASEKEFCVEFPGHCFDILGDYIVTVYATMYNSWGIHAAVDGIYTVMEPAVLLDSQNMCNAVAPGDLFQLLGSVQGALTEVSIELLDGAGKPVQILYPDGHTTMSIQAAVQDDSSFAAQILLPQVLPSGSYTLRASARTILNNQHYVPEATHAIRMSDTPVKYLKVDQGAGFVTAQRTYGYCGDYSFQAAAESNIAHLQFLKNGNVLLPRVKAGVTLADGLSAFEASAETTEGANELRFRTGKQDAGMAMLFYGVTPSADPQELFLTGEDGADLFTLPVEDAKAGIRLPEDTYVQVLGYCEEYYLISYNGQEYFAQGDAVESKSITLFSDKEVYESDDIIMLGWENSGLDGSTSDFYLQICQTDRVNGLQFMKKLPYALAMLRYKDVTNLLQYAEGEYDITIHAYEGNKAYKSNVLHITIKRDWAMAYVDRLAYPEGDLHLSFLRWKSNNARQDAENSGYLMMNYLLNNEASYDAGYMNYVNSIYMATVYVLKLDLFSAIGEFLDRVTHDEAVETYMAQLAKVQAIHLEGMQVQAQKVEEFYQNKNLPQKDIYELATEVAFDHWLEEYTQEQIYFSTQEAALQDSVNHVLAIDELAKEETNKILANQKELISQKVRQLDNDVYSKEINTISIKKNSKPYEYRNVKRVNKTKSVYDMEDMDELLQYYTDKKVVNSQKGKELQNLYEKARKSGAKATEQLPIKISKESNGLDANNPKFKKLNLAFGAVQSAFELANFFKKETLLEAEALDILLLAAQGSTEYIEMLELISQSGATVQMREAITRFNREQETALAAAGEEANDRLKALAEQKASSQVTTERTKAGLKIFDYTLDFLKAVGLQAEFIGGVTNVVMQTAGLGLEWAVEKNLAFTDHLKAAEAMVALEHIYSVSLTALDEEVARYVATPTPEQARRVIRLITHLRSVKLAGEDAAFSYLNIQLTQALRERLKEEKLDLPLVFDDSLSARLRGFMQPHLTAERYLRYLSTASVQMYGSDLYGYTVLRQKPTVRVNGQELNVSTCAEVALYQIEHPDLIISIKPKQYSDEFVYLSDYFLYPVIKKIHELYDEVYAQMLENMSITRQWIGSLPIPTSSTTWLGE